jgi:CubicO group peptidase (beta-lactamase class C family)
VDASASLERVRDYVGRRWDELRTPGLSLAITDRERCLGTIEHGLANVDARRPVEANDRFQIGSISKGFTALAVLQQVEDGLIDLDAAVTTYLPWFQVRSAHGPITIHHLLSHTSGLVTGTDFTGEAASEVWSLRETWTGFAPGERLLYSNVGYKALGLVLEAVTGRPWWETVHERVMRPIGMADADVIITHDARARLATGYGSPYDDRPWEPSHGWAPTPWFQSATADGTICATAEELTAYARLLLSGGEGVVSPASFERMTEPFARDLETGDRYGYGVKWVDDDAGRRLLGHAGGMIGFTAYLLVDVRAGFGAVAMANSALGRQLELVRFALACAPGEDAGDPREAPAPSGPGPTAPAETPAPPSPEVPTAWAGIPGRYVSWNPWAPGFRVFVRGDRLWLELLGDASDVEGVRPLEPLEDGWFRVGEPWSPDRVRFDAVVDGRPQQALFDAAPYYRSFAP